MEAKYTVTLSYDELILLNGKVDEKVQKTIDNAINENSMGFEIPVMGEIITKSLEKGTFSFRYKQINRCGFCDKKATYYRRTRNSKWHNKGDFDYSKPMKYNGVKFNEGFVTIEGNGDMCTDCCKKYDVINTIQKYIIDNDLKIEIVSRDFTSKYLKDDVRTCFECGEEMFESEMGTSPVMMGGGSYPSTCPKCKAHSQAFGKSHGMTNKFGFILNEKWVKENEFKI